MAESQHYGSCLWHRPYRSATFLLLSICGKNLKCCLIVELKDGKLCTVGIKLRNLNIYCSKLRYGKILHFRLIFTHVQMIAANKHKHFLIAARSFEVVCTCSRTHTSFWYMWCVFVFFLERFRQAKGMSFNFWFFLKPCTSSVVNEFYFSLIKHIGEKQFLSCFT